MWPGNWITVRLASTVDIIFLVRTATEYEGLIVLLTYGALLTLRRVAKHHALDAVAAFSRLADAILA